MKHDLKVTLFLILLFLSAQIVGLFLLKENITEVKTDVNGTIEIKYAEPITGRPELSQGESFTYIFVMILVGTGLLFFLMKFKLFKVWKIWFFLAVWGSLSIALTALLGEMPAVIIAFLLAVFKIFKPNAIIHNLTEVFIYAGITIMLSPLFNIFWASMLLLAISVYDAIAVWKSKHMVVLAEAQSQNKMFAGMLIPYKSENIETQTIHETHKSLHTTHAKTGHQRTDLKLEIPEDIRSGEVKSAILGGGDIAFPMMFSGAVMNFVIMKGQSVSVAYFESLIVSVTTTIALYLLFLKSEKGKFYPAMPFLSAGCFVGLGIVYLINLI